jgi:peptidoglycan/xylan/chitin deacetylase (PgdA/CDA1 family)
VFGWGEVLFSDLNLSQENRLLFQAEEAVPGYGSYGTLFLADLKDERIEQLTFFPEEMMLLGSSNRLQIQNRFGVFRSDSDLTNMAPISRFPAFVNGRQIQTGKINPIKASPSGRYLLYLEPVSPAYADLILFDLQTEQEVLITEKVEHSLEGAAVLWSPDSRFFIYSKNDKLYYYALDQLVGKRVLAENLRTIGDGIISSVRWGKANELYYIYGSLVYEIKSEEFFTRSLYQQVLKIGSIAGKIPFVFDPNFDNFWISPDGSMILFNKGGRNIFLYYLQPDDFLTTGDTLSLPYLLLPRNTVIKRVVWSGADIITLLATSIAGGESGSKIFRLNMQTAGPDPDFVEQENEGVRDMIIAPDESYLALLVEKGVQVLEYATWNQKQEFDNTEPLFAAWLDETRLVVSGRYFTEKYDMNDGTSHLVCLSQADSAGFSMNDSTIEVATESRVLSFNTTEKSWKPIDELNIRDRLVASSSFRVYLASLASGSYRNMVMVRNIRDLGTQPLFLPPERRYEPFPEKDEAVDFNNFFHGSRIRRREVSLAFNAIDSVEGLTTILNTLGEYQITVTFFINGDFIRRHPGAVKEIAASGHEVGSLFYTYFNMTDQRFQINNDFIKQGLAKNEDDYFAVTGKELALLWHAPYYFVSPDIIDASMDMNYTYIGRDVDSLDWIEKRDEDGFNRLYFPSAQLVERTLEKKAPGSIVSMRIGKPGETKPFGGRDDYLFTKLDLLINNLITEGYSIVPVSTLMDHAR